MRQFGRMDRRLSKEVLINNVRFHFRQRNEFPKSRTWARHFIKRLRQLREREQT